MAWLVVEEFFSIDLEIEMDMEELLCMCYSMKPTSKQLKKGTKMELEGISEFWFC